jgi:hypothetical protein
MPRRSGGVGAASASVLALSLAACHSTSDAGTAGCDVAALAELPATPLAALFDARVDRLGDGFGLSGVAADLVTLRWGTVDEATSTLTGEGSVALPAVPAAGPWLARTSVAAPGDTLLAVSALASKTNPADAELVVVAAPTAGGAASMPATLAVVPGALAAGGAPQVALGASATGAAASLAWIVPGTGGVEVLALSPAGVAAGPPRELERAPGAKCLAFQAGKGPLALVYETFPHANPAVPSVTIAELGGGAADTLALDLDNHPAGCVRVAPTDMGYAVAFADAAGAWLGTYETAAMRWTVSGFAASNTFAGGAEPFAGLATLDDGYALAVARGQDLEVWRLDADGVRRPGALTFPTRAGRLGPVSTAPAPGGFAITYFDSDGDGDGGQAGRRFYARAVCR